MSTSVTDPVLDLINKLRRLDVRIAVDGDRLSLNAPSGTVTDALRAEVAAHKAEILSFIKDRRPHELGFVLERAPRGSRIPLSFAQQRLWFLHLLNPADPVYNLAASLEIDPRLDPAIIAEAIRILSHRHEILRTVFRTEGGVPWQEAIDRPAELRDIVATGDPTAEIRAVVAEPFHLEETPGFRPVLVRCGADRPCRLLLIVHHICADGWSLGILVREVRELIGALAQGRVPAGDGSRWQYADYAHSQVQWFRQTDQTRHLEYWRTKLAGNLPALDLPTDRPRGRDTSSQAAIETFTIPADRAAAIRALSQSLGGTPFTTLMAAFNALLYRYTGQEDLLVGTPVANRNLVELEPLIGLFVSTMVVRTAVDGASTLRDVELRVRHSMLEAAEHRDFPFEKIVEQVRPDRSLAHSPLFQVAFVFHNTPLTGTFDTLGGGAIYELSLFLWDSGNAIHGSIEFNANRYDPDTIRRMVGHFVALTDDAVAHPDRPISALAMLSGAERHRLLVEWNAAADLAEREASVVHRFEAQVARTPDAIAVEAAGETGASLTYRDLDRHANRLAAVLVARGVEPGDTVAVGLGRSLDFVGAILAVLKAGAAYVPIDPALPRDRRDVLLGEARVRRMIARGSTFPGASAGIELVDLDELGPVPDERTATRRHRDPTPESAAYVMFTSGSTGQPKGVVIPHRGITRLVVDPNYVQFTPHDVVLAAAPVSFDASTFEIWGALLNGCRLVVFPDGPPEITALAAALERHRITILWLTAGLFQLVVEARVDALAGLRQLLVGGDVVSPSHAKRAAAILRDGVLINGYGPTENTTFTCCHPMRGPEAVPDPVPIGRPVRGTRVYLLDAAMQPVPIGVRGELWTGGDGVALGYLNDADLTASRFQRDPFRSEVDARIYRTGDLARYRSDGVIEFLGRVDGQIKIRGFRVEPGEVESALRRHPAVTAAVVTAREYRSGDRRLIAYAVLDPDAKISPDELIAWLRQHLPEYAVPTRCVVLPAMPLTRNGKVDFAALPVPAERGPQAAAAPDGLETQLIITWERVLGITGIGLGDNFFDLGGNSLLGLQLLAELERAMGRRVPAAVLYQGQTVETMAAVLRTDVGAMSFGTIMIQPGGERTPLFVVPGINGNIIGYDVVARAFGSDQPFYGLRAVGLDGEARPLETIEAIAAAAVREIRRIQPTGPYQLLGFCMGGMVAYEVAQQLRGAGQVVSFVGMIDTFAPEQIPMKAKLTRTGHQVRFVAGRLRRYARTLSGLPWRKRWGFVREKLGVAAQVVQQRDLYRGNRFVLYREQVSAANQRAAARYRPRPYPGALHLIMSTERGVGNENDSRTLWARLAAPDTRILWTTAPDSGAVLRSPYAEQLAASLRPLLLDRPPGAASGPVSGTPPTG
ncbi:MAG: amino acid adenylation domain-containing protein [Gemmatimonadales bacterium]|nr:amino acid adenylation domain-containing protein [Gemmatimonadales bacterium]